MDALAFPVAAQLPSTADVVIVGAGLAGLAAARELSGHDLDVVIIEAADRVGGRVASDRVEGIPFALDRGFQVYNPAYPEGQRVLDHASLQLRSFAPGVLVHINDRLWRVGDPRRLPTWSLSGLRAPIGSPIAKTRLAAYAQHVAMHDVRQLEHEPDVSTSQALTNAGLTGPIYDRILVPFLSGVFLEPDLETSRLFGDLVLRSFVRGTPALPQDGMQAIPHQLAHSVLTNQAATGRATLVLNTAVHAVSANAVSANAVSSTGVDTSQGTVTARAVVVATDPATAAGLLDLPTPHMNAGTTWYFVADVPASELGGGVGAITIDGNRTPHARLVNAYVLNNVLGMKNAPGTRGDTRAPTVVAASAIGVHNDSTSEQAVRADLERLYGVPTKKWDVVAQYAIAHALPSMRPPLVIRQPVRLGTGRYVAGDHRDTASIQGALVSGRRAARAVCADLGLT